MTTYTFHIVTLDSGGEMDTVSIESDNYISAVEKLKEQYPELTLMVLRELSFLEIV